MAFNSRSDNNRSRNNGFHFDKPERKKVPYTTVFLIALGIVAVLALAQALTK